MTRNDPLVRLQQHAGLPIPEAEIPNDTLAAFAFQTTRGGPCPSLDDVTHDIIQCLDKLNREINQESASQQSIPRPLVYAASGILSTCLDMARELRFSDPRASVVQDLLKAAWRIQCAWDALVAGDEDDLPQLVATEEMARGWGEEGRVTDD
jgi:hypothetical protein